MAVHVRALMNRLAEVLPSKLVDEDEAWRGVMAITQSDKVWRQADGQQAVLVGRRRGWPSTRLTEVRQASMVRGGGRQPEA